MISPKWARGSPPAPGPSEGQGVRLEREGYGHPLFGIDFCFALFAKGSQGPSDAWRSGPFLGGGAYCPRRSHFHTDLAVLAPDFLRKPSGPCWIAGRATLPSPPYFLDLVSGRGENAVFFSAQGLSVTCFTLFVSQFYPVLLFRGGLLVTSLGEHQQCAY